MQPILYNLSGIRPPITGIGRYAIELLRSGLQQALPIAAAYGGQLHQKEALLPVLHQLEGKPNLSDKRLRRVGAYIPFSRRFYQALNARRFADIAKPAMASGSLFHDINFSANPLTPANIATVYDLSNKQCPETHPKHRVDFLERYFKQLTDSDSHLIAISHSIKKELMAFYNVPEARIQVTHLAADDVFQPRDEAQCQSLLGSLGLQFKQYTLCVGTLEPRKNVSRVLAAFCALPAELQRAFPLVVAGAPGWENRSLEQQLTQLQQKGLIKRLGFVPQSILPTLYSGARAFVYPSIYEGFGLPLLEAMQSGCPCLTSNTGALAEVSQQHAQQVNPLSTDEITDSLSRLLLDSELNTQYGLLSIKRAQQFSWAKTITQTQQLYNEISNA